MGGLTLPWKGCVKEGKGMASQVREYSKYTYFWVVGPLGLLHQSVFKFVGEKTLWNK